MPETILAQYGNRLEQVALVYSLIPTSVGLNFVLRPAAGISFLGFTSPPQAEAQKLMRSMVQLCGARALAYGLATLGAWSAGDRKALGWVVLAGVPLLLVDGLVYRFQTGGGEWNHWCWVPVGLAVGMGLLGWV